MKILISVYLLAMLVISSGCASLRSEHADRSAAAAVGVSSDLKAFPIADAGYKRHVVSLPALENESLYRVTLVLGKTVVTDSVNQYMMLGTLKPVTVEGWGYTYYQLESEGHMAGTLMAVRPSAPKVMRFVEVNTQLPPIRYNSKLPLVVIVPEGFEVKYRVWSAGELLTVPQG